MLGKFSAGVRMEKGDLEMRVVDFLAHCGIIKGLIGLLHSAW